MKLKKVWGPVSQHRCDASFALQVDCAYYTDDLQEVRTNPVEEVREALRRNGSAGLEENCEQCFDNMRRVVSSAILRSWTHSPEIPGSNV